MIEFSPATVTHEGVDVAHREHFEAKLAKVNTRLAKIGAPPATIAFGPVVTRTEVTEYGWKYDVREFSTVTITGVVARLAGWTPVAALDHTVAADEALVARFPAHFDTEIPDAFRFRGSVCDHCNIRIARNLTVLFSHDDGRWAQVGTTCILEYIGIDPATVLLLSTWNVRVDDDEMGGPRGGRVYVAPIHFLAAAAEATRINGFRRSGSENATKGSASDLAYGRIKPADREREFPGLDYGLGEAKALAVMEWVAASTDTGDFMTTARLACRAEMVAERTEGILASLPSVYDREMGKRAERAEKAGGEGGFLGEVGKKLIMTGTVTVAATFEGTYGMKRIVVVVDSDGNAVKTSGSGNSLWDAEVGDTVRYEGKVASHETTKYGPQTIVKMAKVFALAADGTTLPSATSNISREHHYGDHDAASTACYHCVKAAHEAAAVVS